MDLMETLIFDAVIEEGGIVRLRGLPFDVGSHVKVTLAEQKAPPTQEEWVARLKRSYGTLANSDFKLPDDSPPAEIEPLY